MVIIISNFVIQWVMIMKIKVVLLIRHVVHVVVEMYNLIIFKRIKHAHVIYVIIIKQDILVIKMKNILINKYLNGKDINNRVLIIINVKNKVINHVIK